MIQQGGFKAALTLTVSEDEKTKMAAAWALAKIGISINPALYPRRTGSGPEAMVAPLVKLVDCATNELQTFESCMALCNSHTDSSPGLVAAAASTTDTLPWPWP